MAALLRFLLGVAALAGGCALAGAELNEALRSPGRITGAAETETLQRHEICPLVWLLSSAMPLPRPWCGPQHLYRDGE